MLLYPVTPVKYESQPCSFRGKNTDIKRVFDSLKVKEELNKIKTNKDAKKMFLGLSVLAGSVLAELASFTEKSSEIKVFTDKILNNLGFNNDKKLKAELNELFNSILNDELEDTTSVDTTKLFEENPNRKRYLLVLSQYPKLNKKYNQLLKTSIKNPNDINNKFTLGTFEIILDLITHKDKIKYYEPYLETLDKTYSNNLDDIAINIISAHKGGDSPLTYVQMLHSNRFSPQDVSIWAKAKNLTMDEFYKCKFLDKEKLVNLSQLKEKNNKFKIASMKPFDRFKIPMYTFRLSFNDDLSLEDKLKTITDVHSALYGPISLNDEAEIVAHYLNSDIRTEFADNILKDKRIDSVYNFVKYINPEAFKEFDLSVKKFRLLPPDDETYKKIKNICSREIMTLDAENPNLDKIYELLQDDEIFGTIFTTTHSRLRFITRFVLNNNTTPQNLLYKCKAKAETLKKELEANLDKYNYICYYNKKGFAPQFYIYNSKLGKYIKVTLNSSGNIHTIYEDYYKELRDKERDKHIEKIEQL